MRQIAVVMIALVLSACGSQTRSAPPSSARQTTSTASPTAGSTLECTKTDHVVEQLVCNDPQLAALDRRLSDAYKAALARPDTDKAGLATTQRVWEARRDGCAQNSDMRTCVLEAYESALVELAINDPATIAPPVITYNCPPDSSPLTAQFYNQLDPHSALLNWKGDREIVFIQPSGSGARYGRQGIEYWEHQGQVTVDFLGNKFVCTTP